MLAVLVVPTAVAAVAATTTGRAIGAPIQHFLLSYAGVFALVALTAAVGVGLVATDRLIMSPPGRVTAQAVHRSVSFGAVAFLLIHIVSEILAGRSHPADSVVPFLDHGRTVYLGLGTLASDLVVLILVTGIMRRRFATISPPWLWRALHATAYLAWPLAIMHGLRAGRAAKPYVGWGYGVCVAVVGVALLVRLIVVARSGQPTAQRPALQRPALQHPALPRPALPRSALPRSAAAGAPSAGAPAAGTPAAGTPAAGAPAMAQPGFWAGNRPVTFERSAQRALPAAPATAPPADYASADPRVGRDQWDDHDQWDYRDQWDDPGQWDDRDQWASRS
jgi:hypothetical protein